MAHLPKEFDFVADANLDQEIKKILLAGLLEEKRHKRDAALKAKEAQDSQVLEKKRLWHNTPLMLALVGTISVFANGLVAYVQATRRTSDLITLNQLEAQLKGSEKRSEADRERQLSQLKQQLSQQASDADARRVASKDEREFAFKVIERELAKSEDSGSRAEVLLFLVRAGILNSLDRVELEKMALVDYRKAGMRTADVGIPPTLGKQVLKFVSMESIDPDEVSQIVEEFSDEFGNYTGVWTADRGEVNIRERAEFLVKRLGAHLFVKLSRPNRRALWVKLAAVCGFRENDPGSPLATAGNTWYLVVAQLSQLRQSGRTRRLS